MVSPGTYYDLKRDQVVEPVRLDGYAIIISAIVIIVIIGLFLLIFWLSTTGDASEVDQTNFGPDQLNSVTSNPGASSNGVFNNNNGNFYENQRACIAGPTRRWDTTINITTGECACQVPFYSEKCFLETYDNTYIALGQITAEQADLDIAQETEANRLSFPYFPSSEFTEMLCTQMCDDDDDCIGVRWIPQGPPDFGINTMDPQMSTKGRCDILQEAVVFKPGVPLSYDLNEQANIYMKRGRDPEVKDRVFIYRGVKPSRFWLADTFSDGTTSMNALYEAILYQIDFYPESLINSTGGMFQGTDYGQQWIGLASERPISGNLNDIYAMGDTATVKQIPAGTTNLREIIPVSWTAYYFVFWDPSTDPVLS